ncbi:MAG TPA: DUF4126 domain-containing protein [Usitatibacter sp.]|nr:DUF4126 domain-containing protein [Usitatibacter sp.]
MDLNAGDAALLATQLAMGFALAACVGLRTFLPLLAAGLLARTGHLELGQHFEWMASTPALVVFGSALAFEVLADKIPGVDHALHSVEAFVKPVAATILAASLFTNLDPLTATTLGLVGGGSIAGLVQLARGGTRVASSALTFGLANPVLSVVDDGMALGGVILAFLLPFLAALLAIVAAIAVVRLVRRRKNPDLGNPQPR